MLLALAIIRQNRWLFLLLVLFPWAMSLVILLPRGAPDPADVLSILHSECLYALPLVGVNACAILGNEERSRRILIPLARAVSRAQYILALVLAVLIPGALYIASFLGSGWLMLLRTMLAAHGFDGPGNALLAMSTLQLALMLWFTAAGVLCSVLFPPVLASAALWISAGAFFLLARGVVWSGMPALVLATLISPLSLPALSAHLSLVALGSSTLQSVMLMGAAVAVFQHRDLDLKSE